MAINVILKNDNFLHDAEIVCGLFTGLLKQPGVSSLGSKQLQTAEPSLPHSHTPLPLHIDGQKKL